MYNYEDMFSMFSDLSADQRRLVDKEIQHAYHTNALLVKIMLSEAQANGLSLALDTNALENEFLLKQIAVSEQTALGRPASDFVRRSSGLGATVVVDQKASQERDALGAQLGTTNEKMASLQQQTTVMMRDKTALNEEVTALRAELASSQANQGQLLSQMQGQFKDLSVQAAGAAQVSTTQFEDLKRQLNETRGQLEDARTQAALQADALKFRDAEMQSMMSNSEAHIMNSKQFQQMKAIMQTKSSEVVELRKRLVKYEPQNVPSAGH
jgi:leucine zipper transcription factor-like protein 1